MSTFEEWWESDIATPPMPEIDLYPARPFTKLRIYYGCSTSAAKAIWEAGWKAGMSQAADNGTRSPREL